MSRRKTLAFILCMALIMVMSSVLTVSADSGTSIDIPIAHKTVGGNAKANNSDKTEVIKITLTPKKGESGSGDTTVPMPDGEDSSTTKTKTIEIEGDGRDAFKNLKFDENGVYEYEIAQEKGKRTVISYDSSVYEVTVVVEDGVPHVLVKKQGAGEKTELGDDVALEFEDEYKQGEYAPTTADVSAKKKIDGNGSYNNDTFTFTMTPSDDSADLLGSQQAYTATVKGEGTAKFETIQFSEPGEYVFTIKETQSKKNSWKYDTSSYTYTATVVADGDDLKIDKTTITKDGKSVDSISFTNTPTTTNKILSSGKRVYSNIKTGDPQQWMLLIAMIVAGGLIISVILAPKRRRNNK